MTRTLYGGLSAAILLAAAWACYSAYDASSSKPSPAPITATAQNSNAWLEISAGAFEHNVAETQRLIGPKTQICAVLKADAYGHGIALLMPSVIKAGLPYVGVTSNDEVAAVRASGYTGNIMRLRTATRSEIEAALPYGVEELLGNLELAQEASEIATEHNVELRFHLALNSAGMSRNDLELKTDAGKADALKLFKLPGLECVGIMTHFPTETVEDVRAGLETFNTEAAWVIDEAGLDRAQLLLHTANSYATIAVPEARLDLVRPGSLLYGEMTAPDAEFEQVMAFKSRVASVNPYPAGNTVAYDRTYTLERDSRLANIPIGYSDGYRRAFSNQGQVLIRGHRCAVVGRVTMNTLLVDITDFPDVEMNDEVVLYGKQGSEEITRADVQQLGGTVLVEMTTLWGQANPKFLKAESSQE
jgi:alanine racemase